MAATSPLSRTPIEIYSRKKKKVAYEAPTKALPLLFGCCVCLMFKKPLYVYTKKSLSLSKCFQKRYLSFAYFEILMRIPCDISDEKFSRAPSHSYCVLYDEIYRFRRLPHRQIIYHVTHILDFKHSRRRFVPFALF